MVLLSPDFGLEVLLVLLLVAPLTLASKDVCGGRNAAGGAECFSEGGSVPVRSFEEAWRAVL